MSEIEKAPAELYLDSKELQHVKLNSEILKGLEKDKQIIELKKQLLSVQNSYLEAQREVVKRDLMIIEYHEIQLNHKIEERKARNKEELVEISKHRKELEGKNWGYNPETGEIIINNEELQTTPEREAGVQE